MPSVTFETPVRTDDGRIKTLDELLAETKVDQSKWTVTKFSVNKWDGPIGPGEIAEFFQVKAHLERFPALELVPARADLPVVLSSTYNVSSTTETAIFLPDFQIGYEWDESYSYLDPFHDRAAIECCVQFVREQQPTYLYILGDYLDLPEYSKFQRGRKGVRYANTTQPAVEEGFYWLWELRNAAPKTKFRFVYGNHDARLNNAVRTLNEELNFLRPAQEKKPMLTLQNLLRFQELGIESNTEYDTPMWLWDELCIRHGEEYANLKADKLTHTTVQGHAHRIVYDQKTSWEPQGTKTVAMVSPGCLVRLDGPIPRFNKQSNWQQGIAIAHRPVVGNVHIAVLPILDSTIYYGGKEYKVENPRAVAERVTRATGVQQFKLREED
jgi:predicted phosphodiesterase